MSERELYVNLANCTRQARKIANEILKIYNSSTNIRIYGVPRGGIPVAAMVVNCINCAWRINLAYIVDHPESADIIVDDLIDSGATETRYTEQFPDTPFMALFDKGSEQVCQGYAIKNKWLIFPWEISDSGSSDEDIFTRLIEFVGENPTRNGLLNTPTRMMKAWKEWTSGYETDFVSLMTTFDNDEDYNQMVTVRDIPFYSHCEHHLAPFFGTADISYIPNGKIVGLSKLSRILQGYAKRLQVQERLTNQIANCIEEHLSPVGVGVIVRARHLCMESRGIGQQGHHTVTTALHGVYLESEVRHEFLRS